MSPLQDTYYTGDNVCDLQRGFYSLYVYCNILEDVVVGDVKAPLLRTVNINGKDDKMVSRIYQTVQYVTVQRRKFDTIEIYIRYKGRHWPTSAISTRKGDRDTSFPFEKTLFLKKEVGFGEILL